MNGTLELLQATLAQLAALLGQPHIAVAIVAVAPWVALMVIYWRKR